jgi:hypothetical protein
MMNCKPGRVHDYDIDSRWCGNGCGVRDDGRVISWEGTVLRRSDDEYQTKLDEERFLYMQ